MYPLIDFNPLGFALSMSTGLVLDLVCWIVGAVVFCFLMRNRAVWWKNSILACFTPLIGFLGARIFHLIWESSTPISEISFESLLVFDGMTFYGALLFGWLTFHILAKSLYRLPNIRDTAYDFTAIIVAFIYAVLRVGCFANGCCWGRLCRYPWRVVYTDPNTVMPYIGIPVHPVQLYDSFAGVLIGVILIAYYRSRRKIAGLLFPIFIFLQAVARLITETFRGDSYRRDDLLLHLSTSQWISICLILLSGYLAKRKLVANPLK
jgi:phosphatidylglycerol:prolipoprotein diacylglycerol transferase